MTPRSLMVWVGTWLYMSVALLICLPVLLLTGRLDFTYRMARRGLRLLFWLAGVKVEVEGGELLPAAGGVVYMANHASYLDPPVLLAELPGEIAFVAKRSLFNAPVLGWILRLGGMAPVDRADRAGSQDSLAAAALQVQNGRPFLIFPEGTRTRDGGLLPFKKGPFYFAEQAAVPVVAVSLVGTGALMPRGQWRIRPGVVRMRIHPPIVPSQWRAEPDPRAALAALVRARLSDG